MADNQPPAPASIWTPEEIERLARITPADISDAKADLAGRDPALAANLSAVRKKKRKR